MMVSTKDLEELINTTMKDCPLPSVADLMLVAKEEDSDVFSKFIMEHYSASQINEGLIEINRRIKLMDQLYGLTQHSDQNPTDNSDGCQ